MTTSDVSIRLKKSTRKMLSSIKNKNKLDSYDSVLQMIIKHYMGEIKNE